MKKLILVILAFGAFAFFTGCGQKGKTSIAQATVIKAWMPDKMTAGDPQSKCGFYENEIYYLSEAADEVSLRFHDLTGEATKHLTFPVGNGPGEVQPVGISSVKIVEDMIYIVNMQTRKVSLFTILGEYQDEIPFNDDMGFVYTIEPFGDKLYYQGLFKNKIGIIDLKTGALVKKVEYEKPLTDMTKAAGSELKAGALSLDPKTGNISIGYYNGPYRVEVYDGDLNHIRTMTRSLKEKYETMKIGGMSAGHILISSLHNDTRYLYASFGGGQKTSRDGDKMKIEGLPRPFFISVFNKESGVCEKEIQVDKIPVMNGVSSLVGVSETHLVFLIADFDDTLSRITVEKGEARNQEILEQLGISIQYAFVVTDNPLYEQ